MHIAAAPLFYLKRTHMNRNQDALRYSTWAVPFSKNGVTALFHRLNFELTFITNSDLDAHGFPDIRDIKPADAAKLKQQKLLVSSANDDEQELSTLRDYLINQQTLEMMYLMLHDGCNLKCTYCFENVPCAPESFQARSMSSETIEAAIQSFARLVRTYGNPEKEKIIHLYGGEPMLNKHGVRKAVERIRQLSAEGILPARIDITIVTNGTLLHTDDADFFASHDVTVGLSIDGPEQLTNLHRIPKKKSLNVYQSVLGAYTTLRAKNVRTGLSVTLTPETLNHFDDVLTFLIDELGIEDGLSLNMLHFVPTMGIDDAYYQLAARCLIRAYERFRELGIYEERMMRKATAFVDKHVLYADCGVTGNQIVVAPDGAVGVCQDFIKPRHYFRGSVFDPSFDPIKSGLFDDWRKRSPLFMDACRSCSALGICGGGCPANAELVTGDRWNVDERICPHSKQSLEWLIWTTHEQMMSIEK